MSRRQLEFITHSRRLGNDRLKLSELITSEQHDTMHLGISRLAERHAVLVASTDQAERILKKGLQQQPVIVLDAGSSRLTMVDLLEELSR